MKKYWCFIMATAFCFSCQRKDIHSDKTTVDHSVQIAEANAMLDSVNRAASEADFATYFNFYTDSSVFAGTDATERWNKKQFMDFAKPYFDKGKAWNFSSVDRHIYFDQSGELAWFDELLATQMKLCRGSGVLVKSDNGWKLEQYILSATIPNPIMDSVVKLKSPDEDSLMQIMKSDWSDKDSK